MSADLVRKVGCELSLPAGCQVVAFGRLKVKSIKRHRTGARPRPFESFMKMIAVSEINRVPGPAWMSTKTAGDVK